MSKHTSKIKYSTGRKVQFLLTFLLFFLAILTVLGEVYVRNFSEENFSRKKYIPPPYDTAKKDEVLGWRMTPGYSFEGKNLDAAGQEYTLSLRFDENGFKSFGDVNSNRPKVFFIGDSYTASVDVSNEKSYFDLIQAALT